MTKNRHYDVKWLKPPFWRRMTKNRQMTKNGVEWRKTAKLASGWRKTAEWQKMALNEKPPIWRRDDEKPPNDKKWRQITKNRQLGVEWLKPPLWCQMTENLFNLRGFGSNPGRPISCFFAVCMTLHYSAALRWSTMHGHRLKACMDCNACNKFESEGFFEVAFRAELYSFPRRICKYHVSLLS